MFDSKHLNIYLYLCSLYIPEFPYCILARKKQWGLEVVNNRLWYVFDHTFYLIHFIEGFIGIVCQSITTLTHLASSCAIVIGLIAGGNPVLYSAVSIASTVLIGRPMFRSLALSVVSAVLMGRPVVQSLSPCLLPLLCWWAGPYSSLSHFLFPWLCR